MENNGIKLVGDDVARQLEQEAKERYAKLPRITIIWDAEAQDVGLDVDPTQFKNWEFIIACLEQAKMKANNIREMQQRAQQAQMMRAQQQDAAALMAIRGNLRR